ncbi:Hint domain-containing protein [Rhodophyticola sp. CCM32]|uniref:Hint domain-containing protein n=1 Tax=Rhodophyticola sp. CCM32 TaxID=2916397 RepID=UPI00143CE455|nr:Hint domain-containing protein [Rhodophyticola sp. CCM32]
MDRNLRPEADLYTHSDTKLDAALPTGAIVLTLDGALPVEHLVPGDRVITRDGGAQSLRAVVRRKVPANLRMVQIRCDALGGKPETDIVLLPHQPVLIRDWRAKLLYGEPQATIAAERLIDGEHITWASKNPAYMISLHFNQMRIVYAAGLELQSAAPDNAPGFGTV